jgi:chemotaxis protein CheX
MMGMPVTELDEMSKSAISELTNMILGTTATIFYNKGIKIDITPPSLLLGESMQITTNKIENVSIPLEITEIGAKFEIDMALAENVE